jgi:hypothetical protein
VIGSPRNSESIFTDWYLLAEKVERSEAAPVSFEVRLASAAGVLDLFAKAD